MVNIRTIKSNIARTLCIGEFTPIEVYLIAKDFREEVCAAALIIEATIDLMLT